MNRLVKAGRLLHAYTLGRRGREPSTAAFWYTKEPPRLGPDDDPKGLWPPDQRAPLYFIDYSSKLRYPLVNDRGIVVLNYDEPIGKQVNPEAAFQVALAHADAAVQGGEPDSLIRYLDYFLATQGQDGQFDYAFDWHESKAPWGSALAQSRGASAFLRGYLLVGSEAYREAAEKALTLFEIPIERGGFLAAFPGNGVPYFEEYPAGPRAVVNGFAASLMGLWEMAEYGKSARAKSLLSQGLESLKMMLPFYFTEWWSLYDYVPAEPTPNYHSPRYHRMFTGYLGVLASITGDSVFRQFHRRGQALDTPMNRSRAFLEKLRFKITYR